MSDLRELLEQERRRFRMGQDSFRALERLRARRHRNRRIASGVVALVIAAAGVGGGLYALRDPSGRPGASPSPSVSPGPTVGPTPSAGPTPSQVPGPGDAAAPALSGRLQFLDPEDGFAVDPEGRLLASSDGGRSWFPLDVGLGSVVSVDFVDRSAGWVVKADSLWRTTDGGATWTQAGEPDQPLQVTQFLTPQLGWGVAGANLDPGATTVLVRTEDGGESWQPVSVPDPAGPRSVCFVDRSAGWAAAGRQLFRTTDGARSWTPASLPGLSESDPWTPRLACTADGLGAFVLLTDGGAAGHVAYAAYEVTQDDQGSVAARAVLQDAFTSPVQNAGEDVYADPDPYAGSLAMVGRGLVFVATWCPPCSDPSTYVARIEGQPFQVGGRFLMLSEPGPAEPVALSFVDAAHGWALIAAMGPSGQELVVVETTDGGETWSRTCRGDPSNCIGTG